MVMVLTFDLLCISCARVVSVDLLALCVLVEGDEAVEEVVAGSIVVVTTGVIREVVHHWRMWQLLGEQIDLVQEQYLSVDAFSKSAMQRRQVTLTIEVLTNHLELQIESKSVSASCIRFYEGQVNEKPE